MLCALGARVRLASVDGTRTLPIADLFQDDGIDYLAKAPNEVLTEIEVPAAADAEHCRSAFWKLRRRGSIDFAVLSVAVAIRLADDGVVTSAAVVLGAVSSRPLVVEAAAEALIGSRLEEAVIGRAARQARKVATPMDNTDFQAQWRGTMVERYTAAALREAAGRDPGIALPRHS